MRKISLLLSMLMLFAVTYSQYNLDSLNLQLKNAQHDSTRSLLLAQISRAYIYKNTDTSLKIAQRGMLMAKNINFDKGEAICLARLGQGYIMIGNDAKSLNYLIEALKKAEPINYTYAILTAYGGLASVYTNQGEYEKALYYDLKSLPMSQDNERQLNALINVGDDYEKLNRLDSARYYTNLAFDKANESNEIEGKSIALNNLGNIFFKMNQPDVAMANYRLAFNLFNQSDNKQVISETMLGIAKLFLSKGNEDSALYYAKYSFNVAHTLNAPQQLLNAGNFLADFYRQKKSVDSAYKYLSIVIESKDSLYNQEKTNQVRNLAFEETMRQQENELKNSLAQQERN